MELNKQPPSFWALTAAGWDFVSYWFARGWENKQARYWSIGIVAVLALMLMWSKDTSSTENNEHIANMERVFREDSTTSDGAQDVATVVARMRSISLDGCPQDFAAAYLTHIHAWEKCAAVEQEALMFNERYNSNGAMVEAFFRGIIFDFGMTSEANAAQAQLRDHYLAAMSNVQDTFHRVEDIALSHGAAVQKR